MIKVITFDLDDTLWDVRPTLLRAEEAMYQWLRQHRERVTRDLDVAALRKMRMRTFEMHPELHHHISDLRRQALYDVQVHCGYDEGMARQGAEEAFDAFLQVRHQVEPFERAVEVLEQLAQRYTIGALSNGNADIFKVDIGEYFDFAYSAESVGASKPAPDMFHASIRETGAAPGEIVHVGDNPEHDVVGANAVGMRTVWVNYDNASWELETLPDEEIRSLQQLPDAVARIELRAGNAIR